MLRLAVVTATTVCFALPVEAQDSVSRADHHLSVLEREIARLAAVSDGTVGVGVMHLESGRQLYHNGDEAFPMASTYKVPMAVELLTRVDHRMFDLDSMVAVRPSDLHPGSGTIAYLLDDPGVVLSVRNLLELTLLISDNSATDILMRTSGGPAAITARMRALGIDDVRVDRPTVDLIADWVGLRNHQLHDLPRDSIAVLFDQISDEDREAARQAFRRDPRDTATPRGMTLLLAKIWRGEALTAESTALLLDIMTRSTTGTNRIKGLLPPDAVVAHKTGTIGGTTNDVGIITLPDGAGHVVAAVFVKASEAEGPARERVIAHIARAVYDYFLFRASP